MIKFFSILSGLGVNNLLTLILQCMNTALFLVNQYMLLVLVQGGTAGAL